MMQVSVVCGSACHGILREIVGGDEPSLRVAVLAVGATFSRVLPEDDEDEDEDEGKDEDEEIGHEDQSQARGVTCLMVQAEDLEDLPQQLGELADGASLPHSRHSAARGKSNPLVLSNPLVPALSPFPRRPPIQVAGSMLCWSRWQQTPTPWNLP